MFVNCDCGEDDVIYEKRDIVESEAERDLFESEAAEVLTRHYRCPIAIQFSWQPGTKPGTIDLRAVPQVLDERSFPARF
jgi:hypothetical protein